MAGSAITPLAMKRMNQLAVDPANLRQTAILPPPRSWHLRSGTLSVSPRRTQRLTHILKIWENLRTNRLSNLDIPTKNSRHRLYPSVLLCGNTSQARCRSTLFKQPAKIHHQNRENLRNRICQLTISHQLTRRIVQHSKYIENIMMKMKSELNCALAKMRLVGAAEAKLIRPPHFA